MAGEPVCKDLPSDAPGLRGQSVAVAIRKEEDEPREEPLCGAASDLTEHGREHADTALTAACGFVGESGWVRDVLGKLLPKERAYPGDSQHIRREDA